MQIASINIRNTIEKKPVPFSIRLMEFIGHYGYSNNIYYDTIVIIK